MGYFTAMGSVQSTWNNEFQVVGNTDTVRTINPCKWDNIGTIQFKTYHWNIDHILGITGSG